MRYKINSAWLSGVAANGVTFSSDALKQLREHVVGASVFLRRPGRRERSEAPVGKGRIGTIAISDDGYYYIETDIDLADKRPALDIVAEATDENEVRFVYPNVAMFIEDKERGFGSFELVEGE